MKEETLKDAVSETTTIYQDPEFEEEEDNSLSLVHYLELCLEFERAPTQENLMNIKSFLSQLEIQDFLSLKDKTMIMISIARDLIDDLDSSGAASVVEMNKLSKGLFAYALNLKNDAGVLNQTFILYDYCYRYGLADTILKVCEKDYQRLSAYIDNNINISNAYRLIQTASILNDTEYDKWVDTLRDLDQKITPDMLKSLLAVNAMNNGGNELEVALGEFASQQAMSAVKENEEKYTKIGTDIDEQ